MDILFFLIPLALAMSGISVLLFTWAVRSGQFEDLEGPAWRILFDEEEEPTEEKERP